MKNTMEVQGTIYDPQSDPSRDQSPLDRSEESHASNTSMSSDINSLSKEFEAMSLTKPVGLCPVNRPTDYSRMTLADKNQPSENHGIFDPVELQVTNLDQNIDAREMKKILLSSFREHVMVLHIHVFVQSDGSLGANVKVTSSHEAQYAISQLHRKKIGNKKILISTGSHHRPPPEIKRSKVVNLLQEVPGYKLPLFKFRELFERRYYETIGVSEMYNMRDLIVVSDNNNGRMVSLNPELRNTQSPIDPNCPVRDTSEARYCPIHHEGSHLAIGWAERDQAVVLPNVNIRLADLASGLQILLQSHSGVLPLASCPYCFEAEVGPMKIDPDGVPLEHLISCFPWVSIVERSGGFKFVQYAKEKFRDSEDLNNNVSPSLMGQLSLFSRELVDLLKTFPYCRLQFSRFIPAYHHHFGRQCRVADYGFTKLVDLFEALGHIVQVLGEGKKKILTLSHRTQVKRFSSDLLRVLKGQPSKMITLSAFPEAFEKIFSKNFNVVDYGVCHLEDLLQDVAETTVMLNQTHNDLIIAIPKREQTPDEIKKTRQFSLEVIELLRHSPQCRMQFNRFIPAYHHHFGRQCKVADYGFSKLFELFEAIPDVVQVTDDEDDEGEKSLQLCLEERFKILGEQVVSSLKNLPNRVASLETLCEMFMHNFGYSLLPEYFECDSLQELVDKLEDYVKFHDDSKDLVELVDRSSVLETLQRGRKILWDTSEGSMSVKKFSMLFNEKHSQPPDFTILRKDLSQYFTIEGSTEEGVISLVPVQIFARDLISLLEEAGGRIQVSSLETSYQEKMGVPCRPSAYGFSSLIFLLQSLTEFVFFKGYGPRKMVVLKKEGTPSTPPSSAQKQSRAHSIPSKEQAWHSPVVQSSQMCPPPCYQPASPIAISQSVPHKIIRQDAYANQMPMVMPQQPRFQPPSPVVYSGSPVNGSVVWGQMWSPQYSMVQPVPAGHYVYPQISPVPFSWGPSQAVFQHTPPNPLTERCTGVPITMQSLEQYDSSTGVDYYCT